MRRRAQNSTSHPILFFMADTSDHITGLTGLTPTVTLSKNGGSFAAAEGAVSEVGNGWYALAGDADDRDTLGTLILHATATSADTFDMDIEIGEGELSSEPAGSSTYTDTIKDTDESGLPIEGVDVYLYSNSGYTGSPVAKTETDVNGVFTFHVDPGTYYVRCIKSGYTFTDFSKVVT
jgi:hypothetical protein